MLAWQLQLFAGGWRGWPDSCVFVRGLARLRPKIPIAVRRLELVAAVAAPELARTIVLELEHDIGEVLFYIDSTTVLHVINNRVQRFSTFDANRVNFIHLLSKSSQWVHVGSTKNGVDIASRGLLSEELSKAKLWFEVPILPGIPVYGSSRFEVPVYGGCWA